MDQLKVGWWDGTERMVALEVPFLASNCTLIFISAPNETALLHEPDWYSKKMHIYLTAGSAGFNSPQFCSHVGIMQPKIAHWVQVLIGEWSSTNSLNRYLRVIVILCHSPQTKITGLG